MIVDLNELLSAIRPGNSLDEYQCAELTTIIQTVLDGYDIRERYGIKPTEGRRPSTLGRQKYIALHFLKLRAIDPDRSKSDKVLKGVVADTWGTTDHQVEKYVRKHRDDVVSMIEHVTLDSILIAALALKKTDGTLN